MRIFVLLIAFLCIPLAACVEQTLQNPVDALTTNLSALNHTTKEMHGVIISIESCSLVNRFISCDMTATSKHQDRTLNLHGGNATKVQDDTGVSYPTYLAFGPDAKDKTQRSAKLIADTPYSFSLLAENISTQATKVRAIDITRMDVTGTGTVGYIKMTFPNPPMGKTANAKTNSPAHTNTATGGYAPYRYLFATITPVHSRVKGDPGIMALWKRGAYLDLNPNGSLGHNWSKPGPYAYVPGQSWHISKNNLVITFDKKATYTFDISKHKVPMITYLDQGGAFKMIAYKKHEKQK